MAETDELARHISRVLDERVRYVDNPECYRLYLATKIDGDVNTRDLFYSLGKVRPQGECIAFCERERCSDGKILIGIVIVKNQEYNVMEYDKDMEKLFNMAMAG